MDNQGKNADEGCRNGATCFVMPAVLAIILAFVALFIAPFAAQEAAVAEEAGPSVIAVRD